MLYLFYDVTQFRFKIAAQQHISSETQLETIKIPLSEFRTNMEADEIWLNGKLYDVASYSITKDTVSISVFHDNNEESLVHQIAESFEPNESCSSDNIVHLSKHKIHLPDNYKLVPGNPIGLSVTSNIQAQYSVYLSSFSSTFQGSILVPPPDTIMG